MTRNILCGVFAIGLLVALAPRIGNAQSTDSSVATYNRVPLSDSATTTLERGQEESLPAPLADFANWLEDRGVNFRGSEINQWAVNPSGGVAEGHTNVGQFNA